MDQTNRVPEALDTFGHPAANAVHLLCDRHSADSIALTHISAEGSISDITYGDLHELSCRAAGALAALGVESGDRVATLMGKSVDLVATMLAIWRLGAVYVPLFTAFAPQAISMRLDASDAKVVVTDAAQLPKLAPGPDMPANPGWRVCVTERGKPPSGDVELFEFAPTVSPDRRAEATVTGGSGPIVHMFTSGTTGKPKGVVHPLRYLAGWQIYLEYALGLADDDVYWCAADPGWAYGLYAGVVGPLALGRRTIMYAGGFDAAATWKSLTDLGVTNFAAAPTVYRALRAAGPPPAGVCLRRASSAGEPLTPEVNEWARSALGIEVHDHFGQTELGMVLANHHHPDLRRPIKDRSMGRAIPGWQLAILDQDEDLVAPPGALGRLVVDVAASPLMTFDGYEGGGRQADRFVGDGRWYVCGDAARLDAEGDFFFQARDDDVILMAGYRIGPFEVESVLAQHAAVAECAVIGAPDAARGEVLEAFVVLRHGYPDSEAMVATLQSLVKERYAAHAYPRNIHFVAQLPKTPSGKIQRFVLRRERAREIATMTGP